MTEEKRICECCNVNEAVGVCSSVLIPMAHALCRRCLDENAEPLHNFMDVLDLADDVVDWVKEMKSFKDGKYIDFTEIKRLWDTKYKAEYKEAYEKMVEDLNARAHGQS